MYADTRQPLEISPPSPTDSEDDRNTPTSHSVDCEPHEYPEPSLLKPRELLFLDIATKPESCADAIATVNRIGLEQAYLLCVRYQRPKAMAFLLHQNLWLSLDTICKLKLLHQLASDAIWHDVLRLFAEIRGIDFNLRDREGRSILYCAQNTPCLFLWLLEDKMLDSVIEQDIRQAIHSSDFSYALLLLTSIPLERVKRCLPSEIKLFHFLKIANRADLALMFLNEHQAALQEDYTGLAIYFCQHEFIELAKSLIQRGIKPLDIIEAAIARTTPNTITILLSRVLPVGEYTAYTVITEANLPDRSLENGWLLLGKTCVPYLLSHAVQTRYPFNLVYCAAKHGHPQLAEELLREHAQYRTTHAECMHYALSKNEISIALTMHRAYLLQSEDKRHCLCLHRRVQNGRLQLLMLVVTAFETQDFEMLASLKQKKCHDPLLKEIMTVIEKPNADLAMTRPRL